MLITPSFKKSLIVEQFQGNYLKHDSSHISDCMKGAIPGVYLVIARYNRLVRVRNYLNKALRFRAHVFHRVIMHATLRSEFEYGHYAHIFQNEW